MAEVKVQRDTKVVLQLNEREAGRLMSLLMHHVSFTREPWANEVYDALDTNEIKEVEPPRAAASDDSENF